MKKSMLLFLLLACFFSTKAQFSNADKNLAMELAKKNRSVAGLSQTDLDNSIVANTYIIPGTDIRMLYLQQRYQNIPVYNQLNVLAFKNEQLVSNTGSRIVDPELRSNNAVSVPAVTAEMAVVAALTACDVHTAKVIIAQQRSADGNKLKYGDLGVATENISAELIWFPVADGNEMKLAWQIFVAPRKSTDYWLIRVDAANKQIINKESLTVYCNWDKPEHSMKDHLNQHVKGQKSNGLLANGPYVVNNATYRVIPYPAESPIHPGGAHALRTNPWLMAPGNATSLGWHYDGSVYYSSSRGNNVYAYEDRNADNIPGLSAVSSTPQPDLNFNFTPNYTLEPTITSPAPNQQFNTTNLFYWNNLIHDIMYIYGFTEPSRNFQNNNQGRGGLGLDYILAEAQDGSGTNNANFATPPDGSRPRMQMYLWTAPTPDRDGDVDNGIIIHEYGHGISNRMTGLGSGCLSNAEQMGEGWSDYFALMLTHNWATALPGDGFSSPRGIGTYALNQPITGVGIRQYRYTTDMSVNPLTYSNLPTVVHPHGTGTIWCTVLWDMTWAIIQTAGINPNLHNIGANGGNAIALKLVTEGLRLQPCSPGFIDGRNAILNADAMFFGGQYNCIIMNAFARRGMGVGASQGSSGSRTDQTVSFVNCTPACNAPTGLTSSAITTNSATVSWTAVSGAVSYTVDYKANSSGTWINAATTASTSVNLTGLSASTLYDWRVRTNCSGSNSAYVQAQFTTATPVCNAPTGLISSAITSNSATVSWTAVGGAVSYTVNYKANSSGTWINAATTASTSVNLSGLSPSTLYDWRVRTNCASSSSGYAQAQFTTAAFVCNAPGGLNTIAITTNSATVNWSAVSGAVNYTVDYKANSSATWINAATTASTSVNLSGLSPSTLYDWRVRTNCASSSSGYTQAQFTTAAFVCNAPGSLNTTAITTNSVTVSWSAVSGAVNYTVDYKANSSATWINAATTASTSVNLSGLSPSTLYDWRVRTNCSSSSSGYAQAQFTTATPPPTCPGVYDVSTNGTLSGAATIPLDTDVKGLINPSGDKDHYRFMVATSGSITLTLTTLPANYDLRLFDATGHKIGESKKNGTNNETITKNLAAGTYYALVYPKGGAYHATSCYTLHVETGAASFGDGEIIVVDRISVFPNPVSKTVTVNIPDITRYADIRIFDMQGRLLVQTSSNQATTQLHVAELAAGFYLVKVTNNGKESSFKIVKK